MLQNHSFLFKQRIGGIDGSAGLGYGRERTVSSIGTEEPIPIKSDRNLLYLLTLSSYALHLAVQIMREPLPTSFSLKEQQVRSGF